jgi:hypothetical protein
MSSFGNVTVGAQADVKKAAAGAETWRTATTGRTTPNRLARRYTIGAGGERLAANSRWKVKFAHTIVSVCK